MPKFTGVRCEECPNTMIEGEGPKADEWKTVMVTNRGEIILSPNQTYITSPEWERHYLCSTTCLFNHIARLLQIDPVTLHR